MIAALPWYDLPEVRPWTDRMWRGLAALLPDAPPELDRELHHDHLLERTDLIWSQTCGYVVALDDCPPIEIIATPHYRARGCLGPHYRSFIVTTHPIQSGAQLRGARAAVNEPCSHSGTNALRCFVAPWGDGGPFFSRILQTGSHRASLQALRRGEADVAAIDCVFWALAERHAQHLLSDLVVSAITPSAPAPPFVTTAGTDRAPLQRALQRWLADPQTAPVRQALRLGGCSLLERSSYRVILEMERSAAETVPPLCARPRTQSRW